jgi:hypothetical protein
MKGEKSFMKKKFFKTLALLFAVSLVFMLAACSGTSSDATTVTTEPPVISKTAQPATVTAALDYFNKVMDAVKTGKPAVSPKVSKDISNVVCDNASLKAAIPTLKSYMLSTKADSAKYGADLKNIFPVKGQDWGSRLTAADVRYANCLQALKTYEITIRFNDATEPAPLSSSLGKAFDLTTKDAILKEFGKADSYLTVDKLDLLYTGCYILCSVDRATDQVLSVTYIMNVNATSTVTGTGSLEAMGKVPLSLTYSSNVTYTLDWTKPS